MLFNLFFLITCFTFIGHCTEIAIGTICYKQVLETHPRYAAYRKEFGGFLKPGLTINTETGQKIRQKLLLLETNYLNELKKLHLKKAQAVTPIMNSRKYSSAPEQAFLDSANELTQLEVDYRLKAIELKNEFENRRTRLLQPVLINEKDAQKLIDLIKNDIEQAVTRLSDQHNIDLVQNECPTEKTKEPIFKPFIINGLVLPPTFRETTSERRESRTRRNKIIKSYLQEAILLDNSPINTPPFFPATTTNLTDNVITEINRK
jgi:hypothetical protein